MYSHANDSLLNPNSRSNASSLVQDSEYLQGIDDANRLTHLFLKAGTLFAAVAIAYAFVTSFST